MKAVNLKQRVIGAVVLVGLAVIFLPMLLQKSKGPQIKLQAIPARPAAPTVSVPQTLPPVPAAPKVSPSPQPAWTLQLGAFANQKNVNQLLANLRKAGYPAYMQTQSIQSKIVYKIYIGPELDQKKLEAEAKKLQASMKLTGKIIPYQVIDAPAQEQP